MVTGKETTNGTAGRSKARANNVIAMPPKQTAPRSKARASSEEIAARAYEIFLARGAAHGNDLDDWLQAEQELMTRGRIRGVKK